MYLKHKILLVHSSITQNSDHYMYLPDSVLADWECCWSCVIQKLWSLTEKGLTREK